MIMKPNHLYQIQGTRKDGIKFTAGFEIDAITDQVIEAAPILRWMLNFTLSDVEHICKERKWKLIYVG